MGVRLPSSQFCRGSTMNQPNPPVAAPPPTGEDLDLRQSTILIVDDNAQNVELIQAYLEALPCRTITAVDGIQAMRVVEEAVAAGNPPDLILLDVMMPRMSGFEVCRKLKDSPETRGIPIMMVTALNELGDIERGGGVGDG